MKTAEEILSKFPNKKFVRDKEGRLYAGAMVVPMGPYVLEDDTLSGFTDAELSEIHKYNKLHINWKDYFFSWFGYSLPLQVTSSSSSSLVSKEK